MPLKFPWWWLLVAGALYAADAPPPTPPATTPPPPAATTPAEPPKVPDATPVEPTKATPAAPTAPEAKPAEKPAEKPATKPGEKPAEKPKTELPIPADDLIMFVRDGQLWSVRGDGGGLRQVTRGPERVLRPSASPDGLMLAYEVYDGDRGEYSLWTASAEGGTPTRILSGARNAAWSPDGGRLLFSMQRRGSLDIWIASRRGTDLVRVTTSPEQEYLPAWSPTGDQIAFVRDISEGGRTRHTIVLRDAAGKERELTSLLSRPIASLKWAPSDDLLFTAKGEGTNPVDQLYTVSPGTGKTTELDRSPVDAADLAVWSSDGKGIVYVETRRSRTRLMVRSVGGRPEPVPGSNDGDSEPTVLPGPTHRAPQIFFLGHRSFYIPTAELVGDDVLMPVVDFAKQLGLTLKVDHDQVQLVGPTQSIEIDSVKGEATLNTQVGPEKRPMVPPPRLVGGAILVPLRLTAGLFGLTTEWQSEMRVLRVGGTAPTGSETPASGPAKPGETKPGKAKPGGTKAPEANPPASSEPTSSKSASPEPTPDKPTSTPTPDKPTSTPTPDKPAAPAAPDKPAGTS